VNSAIYTTRKARKLLTFGRRFHILGLLRTYANGRFPRNGGIMKLRTSYQRAATSIVVAMAVVMVFTLRSFAAPEISRPVVEPVLAQDCTGTLTVKAGQVTINGNAAQTGATVMSGSTIATGSNGKAIIDLGALGRVEVGDNTAVTLTCAGGSLQIRSTCTRTEVEVRKGTLSVTSPTAGTLTAGQKGKYNGGIDASSSGGIDVKVECEGRKVGAGPFVGAGLIGLLALIGLGAAVAVGIGLGGNDESVSSSPVR